MADSYSGGGVVVGPTGDIVVVNQDGLSWSLPKGHIDAGETAEQAAVREVREESGIQKLTQIKKLGKYERYKIGKDVTKDDQSDLKHITMFLFTTEQETFAPQDSRHKEVRWVKPDNVADLLTHPKDKAFFRSVQAEVTEFIAQEGRNA